MTEVGQTMSKVCVVRNDSLPQADLRDGGFVAIGWDDKISAEVIGRDHSDVKALVRKVHPEIKERLVGNWSGQLWLFCSAMEVGDIVAAPVRQTGCVDLGIVTGPAYWDEKAEKYRFRRSVEWVELGTPRDSLSEPSRRGLKSQLTCYTHGSGDELRQIVEARSGVDIEHVRDLISQLVEGGSSAGVDAAPYEVVRSSDDPVRAARELIGQSSAGPTFLHLNAVGKRSLSLESLVVNRAKDLGMPPFIVDRARDRLEYYQV